MSNEVKLTVPADRRLLEAILDFVFDYSRAMGMVGRSLIEIRLALEEVVGNVIEHGFDGGGRESFHIEMSASGGGLIFLLRERGLAFDPEALEQGLENEGPQAPASKVLGLRILRRAMDEVSIRSQGGEGKEIRLVKRLYLECEPESEEEMNAAADAPPLPEELHFEVRRMRPHEAPEVAKLAYYAAGYTCSKLQLFDPALLRLMNDRDALASFVAVTDHGQIMGHVALLFHDESPLVPELGLAFVKPGFRRRGCMKRLTAWLVEEARQRKVHGLFALGGCSHAYAQQAMHDLGLMPCALRLVCAPLRGSGGKDNLLGRESFITCHRYMHAGPGKPLFFPSDHVGMLEKIYGWQDRQVSVSIAPEGLELSERPLSVEFSMNSQATASMRVKRYGKGIAAEVRRWLHRACLEQVEVIFLSLNLSDPLTSGFVPQFEAMGFFFAGVMPGGGGKDYLILQYLNKVNVDFEALQAGNEQGSELIAYVRECAARAGS